MGVSCGAGQDVLQFADRVTTLALFARTMEVVRFELRHRCDPGGQAGLSYLHKFAVPSPYLGCCGTTKSIMLLGLNYFNGSRWGRLGIVIGRNSVRHDLGLIHVVFNGMFRVGLNVVVVDSIWRQIVLQWSLVAVSNG